MSISKAGVWKHGKFEENLLSTYNFFSSFSNASSTVTYSSNQYTVTSPVNTSTWGSQITLTNNAKIVVPYGCIYRVMLDVQVPTQHTIVIDINNRAASGTNWSGNDNDLSSQRTATTFTIPANTWTTITWGSANMHASNTNKEDIYVYDSIGLRNSSDTAATTWYIKNPRVYLGFNLQEKASISESTMNATQFYEI